MEDLSEVLFVNPQATIMAFTTRTAKYRRKYPQLLDTRNFQYTFSLTLAVTGFRRNGFKAKLQFFTHSSNSWPENHELMGFQKIIFNKMHLKLAHRRLLFYLFHQ